MLHASLSTLPAFVAYFALGAAFLALFLLSYVWLTPQREFSLILQGNTSAAVSLGGALLGFVLPLTSAIAHSVSLPDLAVWGAVAWLVQLFTLVVLRFCLRDLRRHIEDDRLSVALLVGAVCVAVGAVNAAAMSY